MYMYTYARKGKKYSTKRRHKINLQATHTEDQYSVEQSSFEVSNTKNFG